MLDSVLYTADGKVLAPEQRQRRAYIDYGNGQGGFAATLYDASGNLIGQGDTNGYLYVDIGAASIEVPTDIQSILRTLGFSTTTALTANSAYTSSTLDGLTYKRITGRAYSDQASASSGFVVQQSDDGTTWDAVYSASVTAATVSTYDIELYLRYVRVVYTNGTTNQTTFRLSGYLAVQ